MNEKQLNRKIQKIIIENVHLEKQVRHQKSLEDSFRHELKQSNKRLLEVLDENERLRTRIADLELG
ncbi:hypothetical protein SAMN05216187_11092 [Jeotgalicoccus aerolatus]|uniref:Uncharacterized protein n=1 Tax=Jeotgalicoccus aerolatus TaxID=709510 RepID=A0A1G9CY69_9STAP|nr:hypothetical protein [Jeotgalicoccus aerolatus]SDK56638.1 hypothetical protein SAMN05216187_11092 [Jeotgalicoccus aerolatus]